MQFRWRKIALSRIQLPFVPETPMAKPNYSFEKRKRDMDKKAKKAEKQKRKAEHAANPTAATEEGAEEATPTEPTASE